MFDIKVESSINTIYKHVETPIFTFTQYIYILSKIKESNVVLIYIDNPYYDLCN